MRFFNALLDNVIFIYNNHRIFKKSWKIMKNRINSKKGQNKVCLMRLNGIFKNCFSFVELGLSQNLK